jgi:hypothetical protein
MIHLSSAMAGEFAFAAAEITAEVERLGPNPLQDNGKGRVAPEPPSSPQEAGQGDETHR